MVFTLVLPAYGIVSALLLLDSLEHSMIILHNFAVFPSSESLIETSQLLLTPVVVAHFLLAQSGIHPVGFPMA